MAKLLVTFFTVPGSSIVTSPFSSGSTPFTLSTAPTSASATFPFSSGVTPFTVFTAAPACSVAVSTSCSISLRLWFMASIAAPTVAAPLALLIGISAPVMFTLPLLSLCTPFTVTRVRASPRPILLASASPTAFASAASPLMLSVSSIGTVITVASSTTSSTTSFSSSAVLLLLISLMLLTPPHIRY